MILEGCKITKNNYQTAYNNIFGLVGYIDRAGSFWAKKSLLISWINSVNEFIDKYFDRKNTFNSRMEEILKEFVVFARRPQRENAIKNRVHLVENLLLEIAAFLRFNKGKLLKTEIVPNISKILINDSAVTISSTVGNFLNKSDNQLDQLSKSDNNPKNIFIVHGHNQRLLGTVRDYVKALNLEGIVLTEQSDLYPTLFQKFLGESLNAGFAIVLFTNDELGQSLEALKDKEGKDKDTYKTSSFNKRPRPNVLLELGYFLGMLGYERVAVVSEEGVDFPSDIAGALYLTEDNFREGLQKRFKELGILEKTP
jgi:predicted nucleotide-binding protein